MLLDAVVVALGGFMALGVLASVHYLDGFKEYLVVGGLQSDGHGRVLL